MGHDTWPLVILLPVHTCSDVAAAAVLHCAALMDGGVDAAVHTKPPARPDKAADAAGDAAQLECAIPQITGTPYTLSMNISPSCKMPVQKAIRTGKRAMCGANCVSIPACNMMCHVSI